VPINLSTGYIAQTCGKKDRKGKKKRERSKSKDIIVSNLVKYKINFQTRQIYIENIPENSNENCKKKLSKT